MRRAATSRLASAATTAGLLPPSSSVTGVRCCGGRGHDHAADPSVAGVEDVVEALGQQCGGLRHAAGHNGYDPLVEVPRHQFGHHGGRVRADLGRLEHHRVPAASAAAAGASRSWIG